MKTIFLLLLLIFVNNSFTQDKVSFDVGSEFNIAINNVLYRTSNINIYPSFKQSVYASITYSKMVYNEIFVSNEIFVLNDNSIIYFNDFGLMMGMNTIFPNDNNFTLAIGGYYRNLDDPTIPNFSNYRLGFVSKLKFGFNITKGISTNLIYGLYMDLYNDKKYPNQIIISQQTVGFNFNLQLNHIYKMYKKNIRKPSIY